ncbi:hypothetical protein MYAER_0238 [Microcystis aeruginosa NIES-2549]|uniref:Uncharacterized protein n=1 Tax=Microcystis aeruginosa NIES-2549 TaxID=1641812 RepID=A0A0F6U1M3_MICAE|nr:hypothetical protein MYAER_0238 [Microcystis aeruginosa NIES-2549]AOC50990.1 hypothetical protein amyaer_0237 [Microcystis aeruginosa NIES-2481]
MPFCFTHSPQRQPLSLFGRKFRGQGWAFLDEERVKAGFLL